MKSQILLVVAAALVPLSLADKPKLNQYSSLDDCQNDKNILFHAAPVSGRCYNLDDATAAFFWNTGGMLNPRVFTGKDCNGIEDPLSTDGRCMEKGKYNSYRCS
ncbi:predicted protein [Chaetomium globosum CBS 148.51]|uniref:Uncharacterized protein n=1 Tax=Chaetomium globosum (strain ATCC 6205 / CBS 148.51 / DSM 1962 / NBRC 6347 / NRRL 1970) TaxID=306901 RepID=Q2H1P6_CHAGB|nr:uncharacterized protein CHGG_04300 [Chaetomium globosum CBS 148.51]EAQ87681.1 predicted protein [Chaetomium globosum CBS 148.51]